MSQRTEKRTQSENLDSEFKKILCVIREHIPYINSNAYLMQCRVWLEKLSSPNINKVLRNLYLVELCGQIQKNKLLPPFNEAPPSGSLNSLTKILIDRKSGRLFQGLERRKNKISNRQNDSITNIQKKYVVNDMSADQLLCPNNTETWESVELSKSDEEVTSGSISTKKPNYKKKIAVRDVRQEKSTDKLDFQDMVTNICKSQDHTYDLGEPNENVQNEKNIQKCLTNESKEITDDNDSWSDITDVSLPGLEFTPQQDERGPTTEIVENISRKYDKTINCIDNTMQNGSVKSASFDDSESDSPNLKCFNEEELKFKIPKDTNYISEDWKNTIDALQLRLSEMTHQNNELNAVVQKLEAETENIKIKHKKETEQTVKMLENRQSREIAKLKEIHADNIIQLEKSFQGSKEKLEKEYQENITKVIDCYETKSLEINKQNESMLRKKDDEICKLTEAIQQQCTRDTNDISTLQNQVTSCSCDKKLLLLKKCVSKMDKLFQRSEKEYVRQIERLRQELEIKNTALQIQLKMQKAELVADTSSERQEEFDKILNSLEIKYIKILEMHENQIMEMKKQDDEKIQTLKELLSKHGIPYDDHYV